MAAQFSSYFIATFEEHSKKSVEVRLITSVRVAYYEANR